MFRDHFVYDFIRRGSQSLGCEGLNGFGVLAIMHCRSGSSDVVVTLRLGRGPCAFRFGVTLRYSFSPQLSPVSGCPSPEAGLNLTENMPPWEPTGCSRVE